MIGPKYIFARNPKGRPMLQHVRRDGSYTTTVCGADMSLWSRSYTDTLCEVLLCKRCAYRLSQEDITPRGAKP